MVPEVIYKTRNGTGITWNQTRVSELTLVFRLDSTNNNIIA